MKRDIFLATLLAFTAPAIASEESVTTNAPPEYQRDATQSFFEPGSGTHNIIYAANHLPSKFWGERFPTDLVIASDIGTNVSRYSRDGSLQWRVTTYPKTVRSIDIEGNKVVAHAGTNKLIIDIASGKVLKTEQDQKIYLFNKISSGIRISGINESGKGMVRVGDRDLPIITQWARDALITNNRIYVSDTFGHRVVTLDLKSLKVISQRTSYYPNDLFLMNGKVILVEEHANRLIDVDSGKVIFACPLWHYTQNKTPVQDLERSTTKYNSPNKVGRCAREFMGMNTLYSANGATYLNGTTIVADTDNHRIIAINDGEVVSELQNINNPVRVLAVHN